MSLPVKVVFTYYGIGLSNAKRLKQKAYNLLHKSYQLILQTIFFLREKCIWLKHPNKKVSESSSIGYKIAR